MSNNARHVKRRNHEVPRGLLRNWIGSCGGKARFHYRSLHDFQTKFEVGQQAKFAITDYLYVPYSEKGERDDELENWFSIDENSLAKLAKAARRGRPEQITQHKLITQAIRACVALGYRSAYQFYCTTEFFARNQRAPGPGIVHHAAVQNAWHTYRLKFAQLLNWDYRILYGLCADLLTNDRPFHDWTLRSPPQSLVTMPLAPSALLIGKPPDDQERRELTFAFVPFHGNDSIIDQHNRFILETARHWVVAKTEAQLAAIAAELLRRRVQERMKLDRGVFFKRQEK